MFIAKVSILFPLLSALFNYCYSGKALAMGTLDRESVCDIAETSRVQGSITRRLDFAIARYNGS